MTISPLPQAPAPTLASDGLTRLVVDGPAHGPPIVLVCGATLTHEIWAPLVEPLVRAGQRVVRYDLPGRGQTPLGPRGAGFEAHLAQLHAVVAALQPSPPVRLVGLASGALIAAACAARQPEQIGAVGLIAPDGAATHFTWRERLLAQPGIGEVLLPRLAQRTLLARVPRYSRDAATQVRVRQVLTASMRSPGFVTGVLATMRDFPLREGERVYRQLADSRVPTTVVWGAEDGITPPQAAPLFTAWFGSAAVHLMPGTGHLPFVEHPDQVADWLLAR